MNKTYPWGKTLIFTFAVLLPAGIIGASTYGALPTAFWIVAAMLGLTCGIAGVFLYFSGDATPKISKYCSLAHIVIGVVVCGGLVVHLNLARDLAASIENSAEKRSDDEFNNQMKDNEAARQLAVLEAQRKLTDAETRRLAQLRRDGVTVSGSPRQFSGLQPPAEARPKAEKPPATPAQVRNTYSPWLIGCAIADVICSVLAGLILAALWEWDRDHDGVKDAPRRSIPGLSPPAGETAGPKP